MPKRVPVSDAELEVLKVLWAGGAMTVRDVAVALRKQRRRLAYNTVLTLLSRLREKGYVEADRRESAHLFRAVVTRDGLLGSSLAALADRVCDGTASPLLLALVKDQRLSQGELAELRELLDRLATTRSPNSGSRTKD
jgi:BlaI family penicillinase repressor